LVERIAGSSANSYRRTAPVAPSPKKSSPKPVLVDVLIVASATHASWTQTMFVERNSPAFQPLLRVGVLPDFASNSLSA